MKENLQQNGFVVLEALLSASILVTLFIAFMGMIIYNQQIYEDSLNRQEAIFMAEEGLEAVRNIRDADYSTLVDGNYGIAISDNHWTLSSSPDNINNFSRRINISTVSDNIKKIDSIIEWDSRNNINQSYSLTTYLSNWARLDDLEICLDNPYIQSGLSVGSCATGYKVVVQGDYAYMTKSGTEYFSIIDISNIDNLVQVGGCASSNCYLSGNLNGLAVQGDYAYIASSTNNAELYVVDISNKSNPQMVFSSNLQGNGDGRSLYIKDNLLYMTRDYANNNQGNTFLIFNLDNPASPLLLGSLALENSCLDILVRGDYAYVACSNSREFQVIDVSDPENMSLSKRYALNLPGSGTGRSIEVIGNTAFVGKNEGYIYSIDISNPETPSIISSYDFGGIVYALTKIGENALGATGSNILEEIQFIDVSQSNSMTSISSINVPLGNYNGRSIYYDQSKNKVFTAGACDLLNSNRQLLIINSECE